MKGGNEWNNANHSLVTRQASLQCDQHAGVSRGDGNCVPTIPAILSVGRGKTESCVYQIQAYQQGGGRWRVMSIISSHIGEEGEMES